MTDIKPGGSEHIPAIEIYKQQYAHFGRMNDLIYKLPTLYSALIGALWFFAYTAKKEPLIATAVFAFPAVVCLHSIHVTKRFRTAFNLYIDRINTKARLHRPGRRRRHGHRCEASVRDEFSSLYDNLKLLFMHELGQRTDRSLRFNRPSDERLASYEKLAVDYFATLGKAFKPVGDLLKSRNPARVTSAQRGPEGGHLLFRPIGLESVTRTAIDISREEDVSITEAVEALKDIPTDLAESTVSRRDLESVQAHDAAIGQTPRSRSDPLHGRTARGRGRIACRISYFTRGRRKRQEYSAPC